MGLLTFWRAFRVITNPKESKRKMSDVAKKRKHSEETKRKMSEAHKARWKRKTWS